MRSKLKLPPLPFKIGDFVTWGRSASSGIWQIVSFESASWNPNHRLANLKCISSGATFKFQPDRGQAYLRKGREDYIKLADFSQIKAALEKKYQKQVKALTDLVDTLNKQGANIPPP